MLFEFDFDEFETMFKFNSAEFEMRSEFMLGSTNFNSTPGVFLHVFEFRLHFDPVACRICTPSSMDARCCTSRVLFS